MNAMPAVDMLEMDVHAAREKHPLGVVTRLLRLGHRHGNTGDAGGEEDRALYLRARRFAVVVDRAQLPAGDRHRQAAVIRKRDRRAHLLEWPRDATHGTPAEARVANERRGKGLPGSDAGE
jgi:hypothetical protein